MSEISLSKTWETIETSDSTITITRLQIPEGWLLKIIDSASGEHFFRIEDPERGWIIGD